MMSRSATASLLQRQLKDMKTGKDLPGISCGLVNDSNVFKWEVMLMISDDCKFYGGESGLLSSPRPPPPGPVPSSGPPGSSPLV